MKNQNRRNFLQTAVLGTLSLSAIPTILAAADKNQNREKPTKINLQKSEVILFQGDSITDAGRNKSEMAANNQSALGCGYAFLTAAEILHRKSQLDLQIFNKGISGNKVFQLAERWQADCIDLKPSIVSILIGVNDYWHKHNHEYNGTVEIYENDFRKLLKTTKEALPNVQLVIGEPFAVKGCKAVDDSWFPEFDRYREAAKKLADEFSAIFIPYQSIFAEAAKVAPPTYWTGDGVHPSIAGAKLMSAAWMKAVFGF